MAVWTAFAVDVSCTYHPKAVVIPAGDPVLILAGKFHRCLECATREGHEVDAAAVDAARTAIETAQLAQATTQPPASPAPRVSRRWLSPRTFTRAADIPVALPDPRLPVGDRE